MHAYIEIHIQTYMHTYIYTYIQTNRWAPARSYARIIRTFIYAYTYSYIQTDIRIGACARIRTHARPHALQKQTSHLEVRS